MQVPSLPSPDETIERILVHLFGQSAAIVVLYCLVRSLWSWYRAIRTGGEVTWKVILVVSEVPDRLFKLGPVGASLGLLISVVVLALQAVWLGLAYIVGNGLSWFLIGDRPRIGNGPTWNPFITDLTWDWVSGAYVAGAAVTLLLAYEAAFYGDPQERASRAMTIFTVPLILAGVLSGLGAIAGGVVSVIDPDNAWLKEAPAPLKTFALTAVVAGAYIVASRTIGRTPELMVRVWRPVRERDAEPESYHYPHEGYRSSVRVPRRRIIPTMVIVGVGLTIFIGGTDIGKGHSDQIAHPRQSAAPEFPPLHTALTCNPNIGGVVCHGVLHWASVLALSVRGLTPNVVNRLCAEGYKSKWSQNMDGYIMNPTMCPGSNTATLDQPDFSNGTMTVHFNPPTRRGHWVIVWRLYDHSGKLVRSSHYSAKVAF